MLRGSLGDIIRKHTLPNLNLHSTTCLPAYLPTPIFDIRRYNENMATEETKKWFIPLESDPELFTELIHTLGMSKRLVFHDLLTLSTSGADAELLVHVPRPALALVVVIPAPNGYAKNIADGEERDVPLHDGCGEDEDAVFYFQTIGNACGLYAVLHAVSNGGARRFVGEFVPFFFFFFFFRFRRAVFCEAAREGGCEKGEGPTYDDVRLYIYIYSHITYIPGTISLHLVPSLKAVTHLPNNASPRAQYAHLSPH